ncbi:30S ribosomal protein S8e [uncultured archaeon]|nr:30S ribosomal protein S8e [uncultured archaeon]
MENYHKPLKASVSGTGAKRHKLADKKLAHFGQPPTSSKLGKEEVKKEVRLTKDTRGGNIKPKLKVAMFMNLLTPSGMKKVRMRNVTETPDNRHHARMNIITKGTIVDTEAGKAKVTNRVGQDGVVNGILVK